MALYTYKALNARGEMLDGQMEAANDAEVAARLQEQGHLPVEARLASEGGGTSIWKDLFKPKPFAGERLVPELLQEECTADNLARAVLQWFGNPEAVAALRPRFRAIHEALRQDASERAADAVAGLIATQGP